MCRLKSAIILKDRVYLSETDSHTNLLKELKIADTKENAQRLFVRAELYPKYNNIFSPIETWKFNVDQDILPDWYIKEVDKERMVSAVKEWTKTHIFIGENNIGVFGNKTIYIKDSTVQAFNNSTVQAFNNSTVTAHGNSTVYANGNSTVTAHGNSTVYAHGNSKVTAYDYSKVTAYDNSTVTAHCNSMVTAYSNSMVTAYSNSTVIIDSFSSAKKENITLKDNAILKDNREKKIYITDGWEVVKERE